MSGHPTAPGDDGDAQHQSRPWTPAAAMEPVPPLAPPPARPGAGTPVVTADRAPSGNGGALVPIGLAALALAVVVLVILLLLGHL
jgi:hypothetical protein